MMRVAFPAILLLILVSCGQKSGRTDANQPPQASNGWVATSKATGGNIAANGSEETSNRPNSAPSPGGFGSLPKAGAPLEFTGIWAASKAACSSNSWRFTKTEVTAVNGPHCTIYNVSEVADGYDLAAQCPMKKPNPTDLIKIRFAGSPDAMLVESNAIPATGLVKCGR